MPYELAKQVGGWGEIKTAFDRMPAVLRPMIEREIEAHQPMAIRDYVSREYIMMLRRIIGLPSGNLHNQHDAAMREALQKAGLTREKILENIQAELKKT
jgi:hypothetical protein